MSNSSSSTSKDQSPSAPEIATEMDQLADDYVHSPVQSIILEPFKSSILKLRAKYATYEYITTSLNEKGVKVSEATVRKFCRTHHQEVKRLRTEHDRKRREAAGTANGRTEPGGTSSPEQASRAAATVDSSRPGPKIARERL